VPEGGQEFFPLSPSTPFAINDTLYSGAVVINEIMYAPISGDSDDEYVELYNRSTNSVDVSGWQLTDGITFTIPARTIIPPDGYLVVARNLGQLLATYPNLSVNNTVGNYSGNLADSGEHIALSRLEPLVKNGVTNFISVIADEVTYGTGGRWGAWSQGGGSSLELIDPRSDKRLAAIGPIVMRAAKPPGPPWSSPDPWISAVSPSPLATGSFKFCCSARANASWTTLRFLKERAVTWPVTLILNQVWPIGSSRETTSALIWRRRVMLRARTVCICAPVGLATRSPTESKPC